MSHFYRLLLVGFIAVFCAISCKNADDDASVEASVTLSVVEQIDVNTIELTGTFSAGDRAIETYGFQISLEENFSAVLKTVEYADLSGRKNLTENIPVELSSEDVTVYARAFITYDQKTTYSAVRSTSYIHTTWTLSADTLSKGVAYSLLMDPLIFAPDLSDMMITLGSTTVNIDSVKGSDFYFSIPEDFTVGQHVAISLTANSIDQELSKNTVYISRWTFVPDDSYDFHQGIQGFKLGDDAYFFGRSSGDVGKALKFNFLTGEWTDISANHDQPIINRKYGVGESAMGVGFLGVGEVGLEKSNDCYLFNEATKSFEKIDSLPQPGTSYPMSFTHNNSIYILNAHVVYQLDLSQPLLWKRLNDAPGNFNGDVAVEYQGMVYCSTSDILWEYDPVLDIWQQESTFPEGYFPSRGIGFTVGSKIYFGFEQYGDSNRLYSYDLNTAVWKKEERLHLRKIYTAGALCFTYDNKAYVFHGGNKGYFIYDPN